MTNDVEVLKQRVAIAQDVMAQIEGKRLEAKKMTYLKIDRYSLLGSSVDAAHFRNHYGEDLQAALTKLAPHTYICACAVGSLILSAARLYDKINVSDLGSNDFGATLGQFFNRSEAGLIELAFEGFDSVTDGILGDDYILLGDLDDAGSGDVYMEAEDVDNEDITAGEIKASYAFFEKHVDDSEKRLYEIMKNIVTNGGHFKP